MLQPTSKFEANWPSRTHWRKATCREVNCSHYVNGWVTRVAPGSPQDLYIRGDTERQHKLERGEVSWFCSDGFPVGVGGWVGDASHLGWSIAVSDSVDIDLTTQIKFRFTALVVILQQLALMGFLT